MTRAELRLQAFTMAAGRCEWPGCGSTPKELAHLHSIGMGGRRSADTIDNVAALCHTHARMSDGVTSDLDTYTVDVRRLPGMEHFRPGEAGAAHNIAEALRMWVTQQRRRAGWDV